MRNVFWMLRSDLNLRILRNVRILRFKENKVPFPPPLRILRKKVRILRLKSKLFLLLLVTSQKMCSHVG